MNLREASNFTQLITLHPLLKDEQRDRITIIISGKQFIVQNHQVRSGFLFFIRKIYEVLMKLASYIMDPIDQSKTQLI